MDHEILNHASYYSPCKKFLIVFCDDGSIKVRGQTTIGLLVAPEVSNVIRVKLDE